MLIQLNIERGRTESLGAFAPDYINVLKLNLELVDQYPEVYIVSSWNSATLQ
jgi:potassium-transporting ATPase KdpC subunit